MNDSEPIIILCGPKCTPYSGQASACTYCNEEVFINDSTFRTLQSKGLTHRKLEPVCAVCGLKMNLLAECKIIEPSEEQKVEYRETLKGILDEFQRDFKS